MTDLIKFHTDISEGFPIDARELHEFLGSKQRFADWIKARVINNPFFEENQDFILLHNSMTQNGRGGHNRIDYGLTIDTAKKISMAEQTARGNEARDYFLVCERQAKEQRPSDQLEILAQTVNSMIEQRNRLRMVGQKAETAVKKVEDLEHRMDTNGCSPGFIPMRMARHRFGSGLSDAMFRQVMSHCNVQHETYWFKTQDGIQASGASVDERAAERAMRDFIGTCWVPEGQLMAKSAWFGETRFKVRL